MSLSRSLAPLRHFGAQHTPDLSHQVSDLAQEVAAIAASLGRQARPALADAGHSAVEFAEHLAQQMAPMAKQFRRRAKAAGRMMRDDPVPAVVAVGTLALLAMLLMSRPHSR